MFWIPKQFFAQSHEQPNASGKHLAILDIWSLPFFRQQILRLCKCLFACQQSHITAQHCQLWPHSSLGNGSRMHGGFSFGNKIFFPIIYRSRLLTLQARWAVVSAWPMTKNTSIFQSKQTQTLQHSFARLKVIRQLKPTRQQHDGAAFDRKSKLKRRLFSKTNPPPPGLWSPPEVGNPSPNYTPTRTKTQQKLDSPAKNPTWTNQNPSNDPEKRGGNGSGVLPPPQAKLPARLPAPRPTFQHAREKNRKGNHHPEAHLAGEADRAHHRRAVPPWSLATRCRETAPETESRPLRAPRPEKLPRPRCPPLLLSRPRTARRSRAVERTKARGGTRTTPGERREKVGSLRLYVRERDTTV